MNSLVAAELSIVDKLGKKYSEILEGHSYQVIDEHIHLTLIGYNDVIKVTNPWNSVLVAVCTLINDPDLTDHILFDIYRKRIYYVSQKQAELYIYQPLQIEDCLLEVVTKFIQTKKKYNLPILSWSLPIPNSQKYIEYDVSSHQPGIGFRKKILEKTISQWNLHFEPNGLPLLHDVIGWLYHPDFDIGISILHSYSIFKLLTSNVKPKINGHHIYYTVGKKIIELYISGDLSEEDIQKLLSKLRIIFETK